MKKTSILLCLVMLLSLCGCAGTADKKTKEFFAMDTYMTLTAYGDNAEKALSEAQSEVERLDSLLNAEDKHSEIYRLNCEKKLTLSEETSQVLKKALDFSELTDGVFNPALHPLMKLWGFTTGEYHVPSEAEIAKTLQYCGVQHIHRENETLRLDQGSALDFGAVAKGYAAELCANQLTDAGVNGILALGGNIQTVGSKPDGSPWRVGVTDPTDPSRSVAVLNLTGSNAVVTSGGYQRFFEENGQRYSHIMDPATGKSAKSGLSSVTIVADSGFLADGLSTALYVMGPARAEDFWRSSDDFECVLITDDGKMLVTEGLADKIETDIGFTVIKR